MNLEQLLALGGKWFDYLKGDVKPLFLRMLKLEAYSAIILIVMLLFIAIFTYLFFQAQNSPTTTLAFGVLITIIALIGLFAYGLIGSTAFNIVDKRMNKSDAPIFGSAIANLVPYLSYCAIVVILHLLFFIPLGLLFLYLVGLTDPTQLFEIAKTNKDIGIIRTYLNLFLLIAVFITSAISFFFQFAIFELLINRKSVLGSIRSSVSLVRANFVIALVFSFVALAISAIVELPFSILTYALVLVSMLGSGVLLIILGNSNMWGMAFAIAIILLIAIVIGMVKVALQITVLTPFHYLFWKSLTKNETPEIRSGYESTMLKTTHKHDVKNTTLVKQKTKSRK